MLKPDLALAFTWWSVTFPSSKQTVALLIGALIDVGTDGYWSAVEVMYMYACQSPERLEGLRSQTRRLMANFDISELDGAGPGAGPKTMDMHAFGRIAIWLIRHGSKDKDAAAAAAHLAEQAIRWCTERSGNHVGGSVITHCGDVVWPVLSSGIAAHRDRIWAFDHLLGKNRAGGKTGCGSNLPGAMGGAARVVSSES